MTDNKINSDLDFIFSDIYERSDRAEKRREAVRETIVRGEIKLKKDQLALATNPKTIATEAALKGKQPVLQPAAPSTDATDTTDDYSLIAIINKAAAIAAKASSEWYRTEYQKATEDQQMQVGLAQTVKNAVQAQYGAMAQATDDQAEQSKTGGWIELGFGGLTTIMGVGSAISDLGKVADSVAGGNLTKDALADGAKTAADDAASNATADAAKSAESAAGDAAGAASGGEDAASASGKAASSAEADAAAAKDGAASAKRMESAAAKAVDGAGAPKDEDWADVDAELPKDGKNITLPVDGPNKVSTLKSGWHSASTFFSKGQKALMAGVLKAAGMAQFTGMFMTGMKSLTSDSPYGSMIANDQRAQGAADSLGKTTEMYAQYYGQSFSRTEDLRQSAGANIDAALQALGQGRDALNGVITSMR